MSKVVRITKELEDFLKLNGKFGETLCDVMVRLLNIRENKNGKSNRIKQTGKAKGNVRPISK